MQGLQGLGFLGVYGFSGFNGFKGLGISRAPAAFSMSVDGLRLRSSPETSGSGFLLRQTLLILVGP